MFLYYLIAVNAAGFAVMGWDKFKARLAGWRIPEKTLLGLALVGGSLGVYLGMRVFRHKTKHPKFSVGVPVILAAQVLLLAYAGCLD